MITINVIGPISNLITVWKVNGMVYTMYRVGTRDSVDILQAIKSQYPTARLA